MKTNILLTILCVVFASVIGCQHRQKEISTKQGYSHAATDRTDVFGPASITDEDLQVVAEEYEQKIVQLTKEVGRELTSDWYKDEGFFILYVMDKNDNETVLQINAYDFETLRKFVKTAPIHLLK